MGNVRKLVDEEWIHLSTSKILNLCSERKTTPVKLATIEDMLVRMDTSAKLATIACVCKRAINTAAKLKQNEGIRVRIETATNMAKRECIYGEEWVYLTNWERVNVYVSETWIELLCWKTNSGIHSAAVSLNIVNLL